MGNNTENFPYAMYMTVELQKLKEMNILDKIYLTPNLSFYYDKKRTKKKLQKIFQKLKDYINEKDYKSKFNLDEMEVLERRVGPVKSDIQIGIITADNQKAINSIERLDGK